MKTTFTRRILSWLLIVTMVLALVPNVAQAADSAIYTKITTAEELTSGKYVMTVSTGYAPTVLDGSWVLAEAPTVTEEGTIVDPAATFVWDIAVTDNGVTLKDSNGAFIGPKEGNQNGIEGKEYVWATSFADGTFRFLGQGADTTTLTSNKSSANKFRAYKNTTAGSTAAYPCDFTLYKLEEAAPARESGLITDLTQLQDGDTVVVFNPANNKTLSTEYSGFYNKANDVTVTEGVMSGYTAADLWTLGINEDGSYTFSTAEGKKLSMGASYSSMPLDDVNVNWTISAAATDECFYITNVARGSMVEYQTSYNTWSAYGTIGDNEALFAQQLYLVVEDLSEGGEGGEDQPGTGPLAEGDTVVIYNPAHAKALSTNYDGFYNLGTDLVIAGDSVTGYTNADIWTVGVNEDGSYTFSTADGKKLSMGASYSSTPLDDVNTAWEVSDAATEGCYYIKNQARGSYIEWYADKGNWSSYYNIGTNEALFAQKFLKVEREQYAKYTEALANGDQFVIFFDADSLVMTNTASGTKLEGEATTVKNEFLKVTETMSVLTALLDETTGNYTFTNQDGKFLTSGATGNALTFEDAASDYSLWTLKAVEGGWHILNVNANYNGNYNQAMEVYSGKFTTYGEKDTDLYRFNFYKLTDEMPPAAGMPVVGDKVALYNLSAQAVLALQEGDSADPSSCVINKALATVENDMVTPDNGGVVFEIQKNGDYYRFYNETFGYLCSTGTGNNAYYQMEASDDADWTVTSGKSGGWFLESRTAKFNGQYSQYLEYYSDSFKTYSMYNVTNYDIYEFFFYPVAETVTLTGGVVNEPKFIYADDLTAYRGQDFVVQVTVQTTFGVESYTGTGYDSAEFDEANGVFTLTVLKETIEQLIAQGSEYFDLVLNITDTKGVTARGKMTVVIKDEPIITAVTPAPGSQTGEDLRPVISATIVNAGENATYTMTVAGETVTATYENGVLSYTASEDMALGRTSVTVTVTREDGKTAERTWSFIVGEAQYQLYFGQLHSHTTYSDGSGSLSSALDYIASLPESANVDFVAFTDHSNYFDDKNSANPEGALYDMSLASASSQNTWNEYKGLVSQFNQTHSDVVAIAGFEMTWSGGPGHMNTFNTPGIVSRNNSTLNSKTADAGMKAYYSLLSQTEGADSISQFNHPGSTFGTFTDFSYWDAMIDSRIFLVEVGNGEGQIGAGGYYPSYEYYTMALDKGWHVAPTNNQDNHKGKWGNANDARDVILTDDFTEQGIYEAIRNYRVYATEDKNLEIRYTVNGLELGSIIEEVPEALNLNVQLFDPDASDSIAKVEVIVNSGKVAYTWTDAQQLKEGNLECTLAPDYSYYYIRVTQNDGDLAVTAPVWVGETLRLGISSVECGTSTPVTGEELEITTTLFNSEANPATVKSVTYMTNGSQVLASDTTGYTVPANGTLALSWNYTPEVAKLTTITVYVVMELDGIEYEFSMDVELDVLDADALVYIGIDASHYNEYVAGNYADSMGNFGILAAEYSVRTVELKTSEDFIAACSNPKYKAMILTAPSRRLAAAQSDPRTYSAAELEALVAFNNAGGMVILAGWSDNYENYDVIQNNDAIRHMAETQNEVLAALGSSLRISDDATYDDVRSAADGVDKWRLYFSAYGDSYLTDGVIFDAENPYDKLYTERFSHYGGASVYVVDESGAATSTLPETVTPVVFAHDTTYSVDVDGDGLGGDSIPKYAYTDGTSRLMAMASQQLEGKGQIIVSGAAFMSNFEVQATVDNGAEKNYSNYRICENLLKAINPVVISTIAEVRAQTEEGYKYTIEGVVTSNASGYDKDTAFFDCIYVQDATGGICCFPVSGEYKIGDVVRITGTTEFYQGEPELQVTVMEKIAEADPVEPTAITAAQLNDRSAEGKLVTLSGTVVSFEIANGLVQTIMVRDEAGDIARVFIDGYISVNNEVENLTVGCNIEVIGLASYDFTFNDPEGPFPRIRVRNRAEVICTEAHVLGDWTVTTPATCTEPGVETRFCSHCDWYTETREIAPLGHNYVETVVEATCTEAGYTAHTCQNCYDVYYTDLTQPTGHEFKTWKRTQDATCTEPGIATWFCEHCDATEERPIMPKGHSYVETVVEPTCDDHGYTVYTCEDCGHTYEDNYTAPAGHTYGPWVTITEPTCEGKGQQKRNCACGHVDYQDLDPLGHNYTVTTVEATCTDFGYTLHTCATCGNTFTTDLVPATGHSFGDWTVTQAPTCTEKGEETRTCHCGETETRALDALGHSFGEWTVVTEATCLAKGQEKRVCACGEAQYRDVDKIPHDFVSEVIYPTCTEYGYTRHTCSFCGHSYTTSVTQPLGHLYEATVTAPTCTEEGYTTYTCVDCGDTYVDDYTDPMGHTMGDWMVTTEPTCTVAGEETRTCLYCDYSETREVPAFCPSEGFEDVSLGAWYHDSVDYVVRNGLMNGVSATEFAPESLTTRAQLVTVLYRMAGSPSVEGQTNPFTDLTEDWYTDAITWAYNEGVVNGMTGTTFAPNAALTREQLVTILYRISNAETVDETVLEGFEDAATISDYAVEAMAWAVETGLIRGMSETAIAPRATTTRAQMATILMRYLEA